MSGSETKTKKKVTTKVTKPKDNGEVDFDAAGLSLDEGTEQIPTGNHIEIPDSPYYFMNIKRKQDNDKMFLDLKLQGPKDSMDFKIKLEYPDYDMSVPTLIKSAIKSLQQYETNYQAAQKRALQITPSLNDFFF